MPNFGPLTWIAIGYLVAAIPVGYLLGRLRGIDLRETGSGNIGATNAVRSLGKPLGVLVLLLDIAKAAVPFALAGQDPELAASSPAGWPPESAHAMVGLACVLGHIFPIYLRFRGGKGVACALGILGVLSWPAALAALILYAQTLVLARVSAVASLTALATGVAVLLVQDPPWPYAVLVLVMGALIWARHRQNLRELPEKLIAAGRRRAARDPGSEDPV